MKGKCLSVYPLLLCFLILLLAGCTAPTGEEAAVPGEETAAPESDRTEEIQVVTTIFPLADIVRNLGGEMVEATALLSAGASPHTYEPTVEQAKTVAGAEMVVYVGGGLDDWAVRLARAEQVFTVEIMEYMADMVLDYDPVHLHEGSADDGEHNEHQHEHGCNNHDHNDHDHGIDQDKHHHHYHGPHDPHVWMDPILVKDVIAPLISEELKKIDPHNAARYDDYLKNFQDKLEQLHSEITETVNSFTKKRFISYHSAWNYFAHRYGLEEVAAVEEFPGREPSAKWLSELVRLAGAYDIDVIFAEPQLSRKAAEVIAGEIDGQVLILDPLGGEGIPGRDSYIELIRYNTAVFKEALQ